MSRGRLWAGKTSVEHRQSSANFPALDLNFPDLLGQAAWCLLEQVLLWAPLQELTSSDDLSPKTPLKATFLLFLFPVKRDVQENDEEAVQVKEQSILELGSLLAKTGQAEGEPEIRN